MADAPELKAGLLTVQISVEAGPHAGSVVTWQQPGNYLIGRAAHAGLALVHDLIASVEHCCVEVGRHGCTIRDLGSRHGTVLNGSPIQEAPLRSGDALEIGLSRLRIAIGESLLETTSLRTGEAALSLGSAAPRAASTSALLEIPGFTITRKLGQGGMGVVYEALREKTRERVAIKTIIPAAGSGRHGIELFQREMKLLAELDHPRIVRSLESGEYAGQIYLVMEFVDCIDLAALVNPLPRERQVGIYCGIICQVLEALQYAHDRKLVHRDVKPGNLLVTGSGPELHAKLADFGLAKNFEMAGLSQLTADDEIRGTLAFMPWEQLQNSRYAKPAVDIYSAAAALYFFLIGRPPGHTAPQPKSWRSVTALLAPKSSTAARAAAAGPMEQELASLPAELAAVLRPALSSDPRERPATAAELRAALLPFAQRRSSR